MCGIARVHAHSSPLCVRSRAYSCPPHRQWAAAMVCAPATCRFPHCLFMLELLQSEHFREAVASPQVMVGAAGWG